MIDPVQERYWDLVRAVRRKRGINPDGPMFFLEHPADQIERMERFLGIGPGDPIP